MILHPEVLRKAQEEIDSVVGSDRMPIFSDRPSLPYSKLFLSIHIAVVLISIQVDCIMNETWRWGVPVPLSR